MNDLKKFLRKPARHQRLLIHAVCCIACWIMLLRLLPFKSLSRWLGGNTLTSACPTVSDFEPATITWSVRVAGARLPGGKNCLVQALSARHLLRRHGYASQLRIGVRNNPIDGFQAHAWLEDAAGNILVGGTTADKDFTPLPQLHRGCS